jgi:hypothetical protein
LCSLLRVLVYTDGEGRVVIFQAAEVVAPEEAGPSAGGADAGREIEPDAEEGGL